MVLLALVLSEWIKIEPWMPEYLDSRGEVELAARYLQLTGGRNYRLISDAEARNIVEKNRLNPIAWKLMTDVYLKNKSGVPLLKAVDTISRRNLSPKEFEKFNHCQRYTMNVVKDKVNFSTMMVGGKNWEEIQRAFPSFLGTGYSKADMLDDHDICLARMCTYATSGEPDARDLADKARKKYPEYAFEFFYALSLIQYSYIQDSNGNMKPQMAGDPEKYLEQLKFMQKRWPKRESPYCLLMQAYRASNISLSKQYASKYLTLESKPFRINWINQAKEILASK